MLFRSIYTDIVGVAGGMVVAYTQLGLSFQAYMDDALGYLQNKEIYVGLFKAWLFGLIVVTVACYQGFAARDGAVGVGRATRATVVHSFLLILVAGYVATRLFYR